MQIMPALLEKTPEDLMAQIKKLSPYFRHFQIDIQDGLFVPNKTLSLDDLSVFFSNHQALLTNKLMLDFHLMVSDYEQQIEKLIKLKKFISIDTIFLHLSLSPNIYHLSSIIHNPSFGLVLNPNESVSQLTNHYPLATISSLQIMTVTPGPQGQAFIPEALSKIRELREAGYKGKIFLDGAINDTTIPQIMSMKYKPDVLCIGSYLTKAENVEERIEKIQRTLVPRYP